MVKNRIKSSSKCYKLIFMDLNMPIKNGIETALEIRALCRSCPEQPYIVGVTGATGDEMEDLRKSGGMDTVTLRLAKSMPLAEAAERSMGVASASVWL